jgi:hypothetical protein
MPRRPARRDARFHGARGAAGAAGAAVGTAIGRLGSILRMPVVLARAAPPASYLWQNGTRRKDLTRLCLRRPDKLGSLTESGFKKIAETFNALGAKIAQDAATARPGSRRRRTSFHRWRNIFAPAIRAPDRLDGRGENIDRGLLPQRRRRRQEGHRAWCDGGSHSPAMNGTSRKDRHHRRYCCPGADCMARRGD